MEADKDILQYNDIQQTIITLIAQILRTSSGEITSDTRLLEGNYIDSMNIAAILLELEETYSISFAEELTLDFLETVQKLTDKVQQKLEINKYEVDDKKQKALKAVVDELFSPDQPSQERDKGKLLIH
jgi:acyl carrier protein